MATKNEVRDRAANDLGLLRLGQSLQHQDSVRILAAYDEVYERLKELSLATWASTGSAPTKLVPYMATLVAENCLNTYSVSDKRYQRIKLDAATAISKIEELVRPEYESTDDPTDY